MPASAARLLLLVTLGLGLAALAPEHVSAQSQARETTAERETAAETDSARAQLFLLRGMTRFFLGDPESAAALYAEGLALVPEEPGLLAALAETHAALDDLALARFYAEAAVDAAPENVYVRQQAARLHQRDGAVEAARAAWNGVLERDPGNLSALHGLGDLHEAQGRYAEAADVFERFTRAAGSQPDTDARLLRLYDRLGDLAAQARTLERMARDYPEDPTLYRTLGDVRAELGDTEAARAAYLAARRLAPDAAAPVAALADLYRTQGDTAAAEALWSDFLAVGDDATPEALVARAEALLVEGPSERDAAEALLRRALDGAPQHPDAARLLGALHYARGQYGEAAPLLAKAADAAPGDPELWDRAAAAAWLSGDDTAAVDIAEEGLIFFPGRFALVRTAAFAEMNLYHNRTALDRFDEALGLLAETDPSDTVQRAEMLAAKAFLHLRLKDYPASDEAFDDALEADPRHAMALNNYAFSLADRGVRLDDALKFAERATDLDPDNAAYLDTRGSLLLKLGRAPDALAILQRATAQPEAPAAAFDHLGDAHAALGDPAAAEAAWLRALEIDPHRDGVAAKLPQ